MLLDDCKVRDTHTRHTHSPSSPVTSPGNFHFEGSGGREPSIEATEARTKQPFRVAAAEDGTVSLPSPRFLGSAAG